MGAKKEQAKENRLIKESAEKAREAAARWQATIERKRAQVRARVRSMQEAKRAIAKLTPGERAKMRLKAAAARAKIAREEQQIKHEMTGGEWGLRGIVPDAESRLKVGTLIDNVQRGGVQQKTIRKVLDNANLLVYENAELRRVWGRETEFDCAEQHNLLMILLYRESWQVGEIEDWYNFEELGPEVVALYRKKWYAWLDKHKDRDFRPWAGVQHHPGAAKERIADVEADFHEQLKETQQQMKNLAEAARARVRERRARVRERRERANALPTATPPRDSSASPTVGEVTSSGAVRFRF
jgi:hypothetical protein